MRLHAATVGACPWLAISTRTFSLICAASLRRPRRVSARCLPAKEGEAGIVSETITEELLSAGIAVLLGLLQTFQRVTVLPRDEQGRAEEAVTDEPVDRIILSVGDFHDLARQRERWLHPPRDKVGRAKAIEHRETLQIRANAGIEKLLRYGQCRDRFRRGKALQPAPTRWRGRHGAPNSRDWRSGPSVRRGIRARPAAT